MPVYPLGALVQTACFRPEHFRYDVMERSQDPAEIYGVLNINRELGCFLDVHERTASPSPIIPSTIGSRYLGSTTMASPQNCVSGESTGRCSFIHSFAIESSGRSRNREPWLLSSKCGAFAAGLLVCGVFNGCSFLESPVSPVAGAVMVIE